MDKETFAARVLEAEGTLYAVARTFFPSPHDCADAVQEAVLRAWQGRDSLREAAYFRTWLTRILINQCHTMLRRRARVVLVDEIPDVAAETHDPLLYDEVMRLALSLRLPFVLHYVEGYRTREIAAMLRMPKGTVLSRLRRARQLLGDAWREEVCRDEG